jgi:hypothetical protein
MWTDSVGLAMWSSGRLTWTYSVHTRWRISFRCTLLWAYQGDTVSGVTNFLLDSQVIEANRLNSLWNLHPPSATGISASIHTMWWNETPAAPVALRAHWLPSGWASGAQVTDILLRWRHADTPVTCCDKKCVCRWRWKISCSFGPVNTTMVSSGSRHRTPLILNLSTRLSWVAALSIGCLTTSDTNCMKMAT